MSHETKALDEQRANLHGTTDGDGPLVNDDQRRYLKQLPPDVKEQVLRDGIFKVREPSKWLRELQEEWKKESEGGDSRNAVPENNSEGS